MTKLPEPVPPTTPLPSGWARSTVESLAANERGALTDGPFGSNLKSDHYTDVGPRVIRLQNIGDGAFLDAEAHISCEHFETLRKHEACTDDVIIAMLGEHLPRACLVPSTLGPAIVKADCVRLRVHAGTATPSYVMNGLNSQALRQQAAALMHGVGRPRLGLQWLRGLLFPVAPLPEQRRIVEAIESYFTRLDDAVATLERVERNLKRYRASVLKSAVEGRLVPTEAALAKQEGRTYEPASVLLERILTERRRRWSESGKKGKYQEPTPPVTTNLPKLPEGWCWATLPQLGELSRGKSKHRPRNDPRLLDGPYPFIQTGDVRHCECFIESHESTYSEFGLAQSRLWPAGTLCITIAANIAETGILKFPACFPDSVVGFLQEDKTLTRYVELFLRTARERLSQYAPATAQKNINLQVLSEVAVALPPTHEQERIVNECDKHLSVARYVEAVIRVGITRSSRLHQSILKWAFEGKLADQDPNDEPASILLEQIKAERNLDKPAKTALPQRKAAKMKARA